jgi:hypothetical protein
MEKDYKRLYLKYKLKYILNKQNGGNNELNIHYDNLVKNQFNLNLVNQFIKYIEKNDMPINIYNLDDPEYYRESLDKIKNDIDNLDKNKEIRDKIYTLDNNNRDDTLDYIIDKFNIQSFKDIEKIFNSMIAGYNKNYIIYYMVLLRFAIKNKTQISQPFSFLSFFAINSMLNDNLNDDELLPIFIELMDQYIGSFPIKKVLVVSNIMKKTDKYNIVPIVVSYDMKNKIIFYESGDIKGTNRITFDDIKQILYSLLKIIPKSYQ